MKTFNIFGVNVVNATLNETAEYIDDCITKNKTVQHVVINAGKVVLMEEDRKLKEIIEKCEIINADGQSIVWASRFLKKPLPERVAGIDLMYKLIELAEQKEYGVYFFGAKEEIVKDVVKIFKEKHPNLIVSGYRNGYFTPEENNEVVDEMKKSGAKILFVAFSSPQKEYWLAENMNQINIPFCMGVGGSFDVVAGKTKRAPVWMQKIGLEWFYRLIQEPGRMWKRYLVGNTKYIILVLKEKFNI